MHCVTILLNSNAVGYIEFKTNRPMETIVKNEMGGHVTLMGMRRVAYRVLVGKSEGRRPLGTPRPRWEDNIRRDFQEVGWGVMG